MPGLDWNWPAAQKSHVGYERAGLGIALGWIFPAGHCTHTGTSPVVTPGLQEGDTYFPAGQAVQALVLSLASDVQGTL